MAWTPESIAAVATIEDSLHRNKLWHRRNKLALEALGVAARRIALDHGKEAGDLVYTTGLNYLRREDTDHGLMPQPRLEIDNE